MELIKRFFKDETASAEATSTVLLIGAVAVMLGAALVVWWGHINTFFDNAGTGADALGTAAGSGFSNIK